MKDARFVGFRDLLCHWFVNAQEALLWVDEVAHTEKQKVPELKDGRYMRRHSLRKKHQCAALVVGHYCHDQLTLHGGEVVYSLGGSVSYITNVFGAVGMECKVSRSSVSIAISVQESLYVADC